MPAIQWKDLTYQLEHASSIEKIRIVSYYAILFITLVVFLFLWGSLPEDLFFWGQFALVSTMVLTLRRVANSWLRWILFSALTGTALFLWWQRFGSRLLE